MRHAHAIALGREQVLREEDGDFEVLGAGERRPLRKLFGQGRGEAIEIVCLSSTEDAVVEKAACTAVIAPADSVRIPGRAGVLQAFPKKRGEEGRVALGEAANVRIKPTQ